MAKAQSNDLDKESERGRMTLSDMAQIAIDELKQEGISTDDIITRLEAMYDYCASDAIGQLEKFDNLNGDSHDDATNGDIFDAYSIAVKGYEAEKLSDAETRAFNDTLKQYDIDANILRNIIKEN